MEPHILNMRQVLFGELPNSIYDMNLRIIQSAIRGQITFVLKFNSATA